LGANTTLTGTGLTGSNDTLGGSASDSVVEYGNNDVTSLGLGSTLAMTGTNEEANLSNGTIWLGANTT
ncbi:hypothetical protein QN414_33630, partial [Pseudomonas sp. 5S1]